MLPVHTRKVLMMLSACSFLVGIDLLIVSPLIPTISRSVGFPMDAGGLLITAYALPYGLSAPFFGPLSERYGRRTMILVGISIFTFGTVFTAIGQSLWLMVIFRAITGLSCAMIMPNVYATVGDVIDYAHRGKAMGMVAGAMGVSTVLGVPLGALLSQLGAWQTIFYVVGALALVVFLGMYKLVPGKPVDTSNSSVSLMQTYRRQIGMAFSSRIVGYSLLSTFLWWIGWQGMFSVMGILYFQVFHLRADEIGYMFAFAGVGNMLGNQIGGRIADVMGKRPVLVAACATSAICVSFIPYTYTLLVVVILHFIWANATGWGQSSLNSLISELNPQARATVMGMNSSATYLGMTVASAASAVVLFSFGFHAVGQISAVGFILVAIVITSLVKERTLVVQATELIRPNGQND